MPEQPPPAARSPASTPGVDAGMAFDREPAPLVFSRDGMRRVDRDAIALLGIPGLLLMERAALGLAREVLALLGTGPARRVVCVCGPGGNGGDGWAAARHLHCAGADVATLEVEAPTPGSDAAVNREIVRTLGLPQIQLATWRPHRELVIDAILGTGATRPPAGAIHAAIEGVRAAASSGCLVVAADLPSGLDADTGRPPGVAVEAALTVTFAGIKRGLLEPAARRHVGRLVVVPIGVPRGLLERHALPAD